MGGGVGLNGGKGKGEGEGVAKEEGRLERGKGREGWQEGQARQAPTKNVTCR